MAYYKHEVLDLVFGDQRFTVYRSKRNAESEEIAGSHIIADGGTMMGTSLAKALLQEIDILWENFLTSKAYFAYMNQTHIGQQELYTGSFYRNRGVPLIKFSLSRPLTVEDVEKNNQITEWLNHSFLIRLLALFESHKVPFKKGIIDQSVDGWEELDLLRELRNKVAHRTKYNPCNKKERNLVQRLISHFGLHIQNPQYFPSSVDEVCLPIFEGCKRYIQGKYLPKS